MYYAFLFQIVGENNIRIGNISNLPTSMSKDRTILENPEKASKLPAGPTKLKPGATVFKQVTTADTVVSKSKLSTLTSKIDIRNIIKYTEIYM